MLENNVVIIIYVYNKKTTQLLKTWQTFRSPVSKAAATFLHRGLFNHQRRKNVQLLPTKCACKQVLILKKKKKRTSTFSRHRCLNREISKLEFDPINLILPSPLLPFSILSILEITKDPSRVNMAGLPKRKRNILRYSRESEREVRHGGAQNRFDFERDTSVRSRVFEFHGWLHPALPFTEELFGT